MNAELGIEDLLASPHILAGPVSHIVETLQERRERFGISYICVMNPFLETFAPVVAQLAGT